MAKRSVRRPAVSSDGLNSVFSAVAHPARRQILASLNARGGTMTAGEIADRFKHSWPTTTRHLGVLERARVIGVQKAGRNRHYALRPDALVAAAEWLRAAARPVVTAGDPAGWKGLPYGEMRNATPPDA